MNRLRHSPILSSLAFVALGFAGVTVSGSALSACSSSSSDGSTSSDAGTDSSVGDSGPAGLAVTPGTANVLTCDTIQFKETGGAGGGNWSVAPTTDGAIDSTGKYSAPTVDPVNTYTDAGATESATIKYAETSASATASIRIATAFLGGSPSTPTINDGYGTNHVPYDKTLTANGSRMYAVVNGTPPDGGESSLTASIYASTDNGTTFTGPVSYHTGNLECATGAVDAANPNVVYMAYYAGHGDSSSNTGATVRLAVSTDGGKTFPTEYVVADSQNSMVDFICPDVSSPSGDHVIVAGGVGNVETTGVWAGAFISASRGANIGPIGVNGVAATPNPADPTSIYSASLTNASSGHAGCGTADNGGGQGVRAYTNGAGEACMVYVWGSGCPTSNAVVVQCSTDNGATWTAPNALAAPASKGANIPTGAVSPSGNVAVTWIETVGSDDEVHIAISKDKGVTFAAPVVYPSTARVAFGSGYTAFPTVQWETDNILWLSQTFDGSDDASILVDKTCDFGTTWSGAVHIGGGGYGLGTRLNLGLALTSSGMVDLGTLSLNGHSVVTIPLAAGATLH